MITLAILEDIPSDADSVRECAASFLSSVREEHKIIYFNDPNSLLKDLENNRYSIYLLDIELQKMTADGIDIAGKINRYNPSAQIIFVSAYNRYWLDVYRVNHVYFVPKSSMKTHLPEALQKALKQIHASKEQIISFKYGRTSFHIPEAEIRYMEKALRKIIIHADDTYQCYSKFDEILSQSSSGHLVQCHKSFAVNTEYIRSLSRKSCTLLDGTEIPVTARQYPVLLERLSFLKEEE